MGSADPTTSYLAPPLSDSDSVVLCGAVTLLGLSITSFGVILNLIVFLIEEFNIKSIAAAQISNIFNGCLAMLPVVAAIITDSFFGDIPVILASTFISLLVNPKLIDALTINLIQKLIISKTSFSGHLSFDSYRIFGLLET